ncbi:L-threonine dehydratase catabolic TdcB [Jannaschia seosinensis]|uniref:L-threonine dehydratase catabolic TdcB n=1 Tax=Jannaschia seosinensis TaxID=313367 RepID=A0A0M7B886_9RHOB|nr:hydroxyectoine utilization dehydratase EutB [Jannaschia seosinensis]CUH13759.1 L-threonine dehydratase catabolic TdcB [Jannaschia seosinensis]
MSQVSIEDIEAARHRIERHIRRTPCEPSASLRGLAGQPVHLKFEHHQFTGSFKMRGATNAVEQLSQAERARGVIGASTGNHGRALAFAARRAGVHCVICMSALVPKNKVEAIAAEGAEIRIVGRSQDDAQEEVDRLVKEEGMVMVPPFDDARVIAGQGTLGLELLEDVPDLAVALVQLSGGGLISGVAAALKARKPDIRVVGITMARGAAMHASLAAGKPVSVEELPTLADSLGGGIGLGNRHTFSMVRDLVDDVVLLSEEEIADGVRHAYWRERQVVEGGGVVGISALLHGYIRPEGPVAAILTGASIDMNVHHRLISGENVDLMQEAF